MAFINKGQLMKDRKLVTNVSLEKLVYIFWGIYLLTLILKNTSMVMLNDTYDLILKGVRYMCYIIFATKIFVDWKNGEKITASFILLFALAIIIDIVSKNRDLVFLISILFALRKLDFYKLVNIAFKVNFFVFFIIISLSLMNVFPDWTFINRGSNIVRHSLGFSYATDAIGIYLSIICMYFYIRRSKATIYELVILETINVFLYSYTDGRTSFLLISIILFIQLLTKLNFVKEMFNTKLVQQSLKIICYSLPIILFISLHGLTYMYANNNSFAIKANKMLSGRMNYTYQAYKNYKITLFGQDIEWQRMGWTRIC